MLTRQTCWIAIPEPGEGVVHVHKVDGLTSGAVIVALHDRCCKADEMTALHEHFTVEGYECFEAGVEDGPTSVSYFFKDEGFREMADLSCAIALVESGEYPDEENLFD